MNIRLATLEDLQGMQNANLTNLPENYSLKYYLFQALTWPHGSFVATVPTKDGAEKIVGYVLAKIDDEEENSLKPSCAHIVSVSVMRTYRRMGLAKKLLTISLRAMKETYGAQVSTLHVRESNKAAFHLYRDSLGFTVKDVEKGYYADGEDAYNMEADLNKIGLTVDDDEVSDDDLLDISKPIESMNIAASA